MPYSFELAVYNRANMDRFVHLSVGSGIKSSRQKRRKRE
jgi:hypothetical protein